MKSLNPYLNFNGNAEDAFKFYQRVFGGEIQMVRYADLTDNMGLTGDDLEMIANVMLPIVGDTMLYGSDIPEKFIEGTQQSNSVHEKIQLNIEADSMQEAEQLFEALSEGGKISMAFQETEWAEGFGQCEDIYGVQWMVMYTGNKMM